MVSNLVILQASLFGSTGVVVVGSGPSVVSVSSGSGKESVVGVMDGVGVGRGFVLLPGKRFWLRSWKFKHFEVILNDNAFCQDLTIEILNAFNVVIMQGKVFNIAVHGVHESLSYVGVIQAKCMSELMGSYQEQTVT